MSPLVKLARLVRLRFGLPYVRRADRARETGEWIEAVIGYRRGLEWLPWREDLKVQVGNCLKEFGDYQGAMRAYDAVTGGMSLSEARKQAEDANRRAGNVLLPFAIGEGLTAARAARPGEPAPVAAERLLPGRILLDPVGARNWLGPLVQNAHGSRRLRGVGYATVKLDQVGAMRVEREGAQEPLLAGVIAVRGRVFSLAALTEAKLRIGEGEAAMVLPVPLTTAPGRGPLRLHVFNAWIDARALPAGRHWLSVNVGQIAPAGLFVNVADGADPAAFPSSDAWVVPPGPPGPAIGPALDAAVAVMPATARPAARTVFDRPVRSVLALRVDQLGDVSASLPALARLRETFPDARLSVLAQAAVLPMIAASNIADEVLEVALPYNPETERRRLDPAEETRLRALLEPRAFDLAVDLSPGDESRPLLLLTGATWLVGFNPDRFGFLDFGIVARSRDKVNGLEKLPHAAAVMMLAEALAVAAAPSRPPVCRAVDPAALAALGLKEGGYVVLHLGARHPINRWPANQFEELGRRVLAETAHDLVLFDAAPAPSQPRTRRFGLLDPAAFDTVIAGARALVGNDSGPKHLAAARGVPVVSVHVDRLNWNEWGQDGAGTIVSKRVPCTGCTLNDVALCGHNAVCLRSITAEEVFAALRAYL